MRAIRTWLVIDKWKLCLVSAALIAIVAAQPAAAQESTGIYRFEPIKKVLEPIDMDQVKPGYIYLHFDSRLNRLVWSYVQSNGSFWFAFGEGTTQEGWRFDLQGSDEALRERAERSDPLLLQTFERGVRPVRFRLDADNNWQLLDTDSVQSIYNAETGHRWEKHTKRYVPVVHSHGFSWTVRDGRYSPAGY